MEKRIITQSQRQYTSGDHQGKTLTHCVPFSMEERIICVSANDPIKQLSGISQ